MTNSDCPFVSVIIPVFNDGERLTLCLAALAQQTYGRSRFEVIVVDNGSDEVDPIKSAVEPYDNAILTFEATPGSYAARNQGIAIAKGEIIAFTDADCIPAPNWLEQGVQCLLEIPNCGLVAGAIKLFFKDSENPTSVELFEKVTAFTQKDYVEKYKYGATANLFTLKTVIDHVGSFNSCLKSSGDIEWGNRVAAFNYQQVYTEKACVAHPARQSFGELYKRTVRVVGGSSDLQSKVFRHNRMRLKLLLQDLLPPINFTIATFRDLRLESFADKLRVTLVMFFVRYISAWERARLIIGGISIRE